MVPSSDAEESDDVGVLLSDEDEAVVRDFLEINGKYSLIIEFALLLL